MSNLNFDNPLSNMHEGPRASPAQIHYLNLLFYQLNYTEHSRLAYLQHRFSRPGIQHLGELSTYEADNAIYHLKGIKRSLER